MKFEDLEIGMEVFFVDPCLDIIHTRIIGLTEESFFMGGCAKVLSNKDDAKYLFSSSLEAARPSMEKLIKDQESLERKIKRLAHSAAKPKDYMKFNK